MPDSLYRDPAMSAEVPLGNRKQRYIKNEISHKSLGPNSSPSHQRQTANINDSFRCDSLICDSKENCFFMLKPSNVKYLPP